MADTLKSSLKHSGLQVENSFSLGITELYAKVIERFFLNNNGINSFR